MDYEEIARALAEANKEKEEEGVISSHEAPKKKGKDSPTYGQAVISVDNLRCSVWVLPRTDEWTEDHFEVKSTWASKPGELFSKYDWEILDQLEESDIVEFRRGQYKIEQVRKK